MADPSSTAAVPAPETAAAAAPTASGGFDPRTDRLSSNLSRMTGAGGGGDDDDGTTVAGSTAGKTKSPLVLAAEAIDPSTALLTGYLRKQNSADKWQKRWFTVVTDGKTAYWCYYKSDPSSSSSNSGKNSAQMLCAMDLARASTPAMLDDSPACCTFSISWDRYRLFKAGSNSDALRWVSVLRQAQALARPPAPASSSAAAPRASIVSAPAAVASSQQASGGNGARGSAVVVQNAMVSSLAVDATGAGKSSGPGSGAGAGAAGAAGAASDWKPKKAPGTNSQAKSGICERCVIM